MITLFRKLAANRNLLKNLVIRDLKQRYVGSIGGFMWSVIHPLASFVSYTYVFTVISRIQLGAEFGTDNFAVFFFCGFHFLDVLEGKNRDLLSFAVFRDCEVVRREPLDRLS